MTRKDAEYPTTALAVSIVGRAVGGGSAAEFVHHLPSVLAWTGNR